MFFCCKPFIPFPICFYLCHCPSHCRNRPKDKWQTKGVERVHTREEAIKKVGIGLSMGLPIEPGHTSISKTKFDATFFYFHVYFLNCFLKVGQTLNVIFFRPIFDKMTILGLNLRVIGGGPNKKGSSLGCGFWERAPNTMPKRKKQIHCPHFVGATKGVFVHNFNEILFFYF